MALSKTISLVGVVGIVAAAWAAGCGSSGSTNPDASSGNCPSAQSMCGSECSDLKKDPQNCGACGTVCGAGTVCSAGTCSASCGSGQTACGQSCTSTQNDPQNCGACGTKCTTGQVCAAGKCANTCGTTETVCNNECVDTQTDNANCGSCANACGLGEVCSAGKCGGTCQTGFSLCTSATVVDAGSSDASSSDASSSDASTDASSDAAAPVYPYCAKFETDNANCGGCGITCGSTQKCSAGSCATTCSGTLCTPDGGAPVCTNLSTDNTNCGVCGTACLEGFACVSGSCKRQNILEDFETAKWIRAPWTSYSVATTTTETAGCKHDGSYGLTGDTNWIYRTDVSIGALGDTLSTWAMNDGGGRIYFGFAATSSGAYSLVLAPNTSQLIIQNNATYAFVDITSVSFTYTANAWYRLEVDFGSAGLVTGYLFDATNKQVATLSTTIGGLTAGGIALRGFGTTTSCVDTITD